MSSIFFFSGKGIGSLITGKLFDPISGLGEVWTFRFYSFLALFVLLVYAAINVIFARCRSGAGSPKTEKGDRQSGIITQKRPSLP